VQLVQFALAVFLAHSPRGQRVLFEGEFDEVLLKRRLLGEAIVFLGKCPSGVLSHAPYEWTVGPLRFWCSCNTHRLDDRWWLFKAGEGEG
jgi:hypothetical protein